MSKYRVKYRVIGMHGDWKVMSGNEVVYQCRTREEARATARALNKKDTEGEAMAPDWEATAK